MADSLRTLPLGTKVRTSRYRIGSYIGNGRVRVDAHAVDPMAEVIYAVKPYTVTVLPAWRVEIIRDRAWEAITNDM